MLRLRSYILFIALAIMLTSCASYNAQVSDYYGYLQQGDYKKAAKALDKNRLLKKNRNHLLYLLERGKVSHLLHDWESSNTYFNEADDLMESARSSAKDIMLGTLMNPMMQSYKAEDFEKYLVHYYKALNYLQLNQPEEAMVEARRISLRTYAQEDKVTNKNKYSDDAFSFTLQGMIYEKNGDINNAFIAYRNAADVYEGSNGSFYGTSMPDQLKKDVLRTAEQNGFIDEKERYEKLFNSVYTKEEAPEGGELILFWENGSAPVKSQQDIWFSLSKGQSGGLFFTDANGNYNVPFNTSMGYNTNFNLEDIRSFRVALPKYETRPLIYSGASLSSNNSTYQLEAAENINTLAFATLKERMLKELSTTLTRLAVKKLTEAAVRPGEKKNDDSKGKTDDEKKKEEKNRNTREALALGLQLFNFASEKADTRNWQSLPHTIYYTRVPLQKGENKIALRVNGGASSSKEITVNGDGGLQFLNVCTLK
ncbi:MAG: hypothetical protein ABI480_07720 [Chitinophagaceae bacterium]